MNYEDSDEINSLWASYLNVNKIFAKTIESIYREGDYILIQGFEKGIDNICRLPLNDGPSFFEKENQPREVGVFLSCSMAQF